MKLLATFFLFLLALVPVAPLSAAGPAAGIRVKVELDFGSSGKPKVKRTVVLKKGSTVVDATRAVSELKQGFVCCDAKDVETIGGVKCDPENEGWWLYEVNGEKGPVSAHRFLLEDGDRIVWRYKVLGSLKRRKSGPYLETRAGSGTLLGTLGVAGKIPDLSPFAVHKNQADCGKGPKEHPCLRSHVKERLCGAVVWLSGIREGKAWGRMPAPVLSQRNCEFVPHLLLARTGDDLELLSGDAVLHTVQAQDQDHRTLFNLALPDKSIRHRVALSETGAWDLGCNAGHRWMKAHLIVVDNPYWALADKEGSWRLEGIPPGRYTLNLWHDLYGLEKKEVVVGPGAENLSFNFPADRFRIDLRYTQAK